MQTNSHNTADRECSSLLLEVADDDPIAQLAKVVTDGLATYQTVVRLYDPERLLASLHQAVTKREFNCRTHILAEALAVAYEFDTELPWRLRAATSDARSADELFAILEGTNELEPAFVAAMVHA